MKKAAIYNPYLDTMGGGERYTLAVVQALTKADYKVFVEWKNKDILKKLEDRFGVDLKDTQVLPDVKRGDGYDVCFWVSDGSIPLLRARKNWLHFQVPFQKVGGKTLINKMKFFRIAKVICNSQFTKKFIDREYGVNSVVVYPPADIKKFKPKKKENIILYVGRFSSLKQAKGQEHLVEVFKKVYDQGHDNWKLFLAGGTEVGSGDLVNMLRKSAKGYPISIIESPDFSSLQTIYGSAKIFWSASGYGIEEVNNPELVEHFGITTVEAMAAKAVPITYGAGGQIEIVDDGINGYLWKTKAGLMDKTIKLINDNKLLQKMGKKAQEKSRLYSYERFYQEINSLL